MEDWYKWVFSGIGVAIATAFITFIKTKAKYFTGIRFLDRSELDHEIGTVEERLANVTSSVCISGNDCKYTAETCSAHIDSLLRRGVSVKFIATNPTTAVSEMLAISDPRFHTPEQFKASMTEVIKRFKAWKAQYPDYFDYHLLPILPSLGFFITDANSSDGLVKIEIYTSKDYKPVNSRPHMIISKRAKKWREYFLQQWENYWAMGS